jgi:polysaccharide export outer membrane protein
MNRLAETRCVIVLCGFVLAACAAPSKKPDVSAESASAQYLVGPGDTLNVFVWRNPELSVIVPVRPDMQAVGKTPTQLARDMETALANFVKTPQVNIIVTQFVGTFGEQIRVVGQATQPKALAYRRHLTVLDVMIEVGGLTKGAAGNRAKILRRYNGQQQEIRVRLDDLLNQGNTGENVEMLPGDVLFIPESRL